MKHSAKYQDGEKVDIGDEIAIDGLPGKWHVVRVGYPYEEYKANGIKCAVCGSLTQPWRGWVNCEESSEHKAFFDQPDMQGFVIEKHRSTHEVYASTV
jgi:hypothetical protein